MARRHPERTREVSRDAKRVAFPDPSEYLRMTRSKTGAIGMAISRRDILKLTGAAVTMATANQILGADSAPSSSPPSSPSSPSSSSSSPSIDRKTVVQRHNPVIRKLDPFGASPSAMANLLSQRTSPACRLFSIRTTRISRFARPRIGRGTAFQSPRGSIRKHIVTRCSTPTAARCRTTHRARDKRNSSTGCARIRIDCIWAGSDWK